MNRSILLLFFLFVDLLIYPQSFDLLKDYQPGQSIIYQFNRNASPADPFWQDTASIINIFSGTYRTYLDSITFNEYDSVKTYHLQIHKAGIEIIRNVNRIISSRNVDTIYVSSIYEFVNDNFGSSEHRIKGWLFPDTVNQSPRCPWDTTIFNPYSYYYRFYHFPSADTFDIRKDTLLLTNLTTDCYDVGYTINFIVTIDDGLVKRINRLFNFFDWSYTDVFTKEEISGNNIESNPPEQFILFQNYPNPFNPITTIKYSLPKTSNVNLTVYDVLGKEIVTLVNEEEIAGTYEVQFDGNNTSSGVYFYIMKADNFTDTKKFILLK